MKQNKCALKDVNNQKRTSIRTKQLKIIPKYFSREWEDVVFPEIRLSGKWLQDSGFKCNKYVKVEWKLNKIIITVMK